MLPDHSSSAQYIFHQKIIDFLKTVSLYKIRHFSSAAFLFNILLIDRVHNSWARARAAGGGKVFFFPTVKNEKVG